MDTGDEAARFARVKQLFVQASALPTGERPAWLARECAPDAELQREVEELLAHDAAAEGFLEGAPTPSRATMGVLRLEIAGFRRLEPLAAGASGLVYRALQEHPRREVALKVLRLDTLVPGQVARFRNEAEILARLSHPGIAQVYEVGVAATEAGNLPWIAMELVPGREFSRWRAEERPEPRALVRLFESLCAAVEHAHARGVVHRDLKPSNVLVSAAGEPKVLDFGIARVLEEERATAERTRTGLVIGTLAYMAPEQARGEPGAVGPASDVYALGVMLFEALTEVLPIALEAADVLEGVRLVCAVEPRRLRDLRPELSAELETILRKALEKEPSRRYASAGALGVDLANWLADRPVLARRPTITYQARKFVRRNRALTVSAGVVILSLLLVLVQLRGSLEAERRGTARMSTLTDAFAGKYFGLASRLGFSTQDRHDAEELIADIEAQVALDPSYRPLRGLLVKALESLGELHQSSREHEQAAVLFQRAKAELEELVAADPDDRESLSHLSRVCAKIGETVRDLGDPAGGLRWFEDVLARDERLVERFPGDLELREDLGWSLERLADAAARRDDQEQALALRQRRLADALALVSLEPDNWKYVRNLSHTHYFLAGHEPEARHVEECQRLAQREVELRPGVRDALQWLCEAERLGYRVAPESEVGLEHALAAFAIAEQLIDADPGRFEHLGLLRLTSAEALACATNLGRFEVLREVIAHTRRHAARASASPTFGGCARLIEAEACLFEALRSRSESREDEARALETKAVDDLARTAGAMPALDGDLILCVDILCAAHFTRGPEPGLLPRFFALLESCEDPLRRTRLADELARANRLPSWAQPELEELRKRGQF